MGLLKIDILGKVIKKMAKKIKLKDILFRVGDAYCKATKSETDDKVWKKAKDLLKDL
jgi:hypothetical protein